MSKKKPEKRFEAALVPHRSLCMACGVALVVVGGSVGNPLHLAHPDYGNCQLEGVQFELPRVELRKRQ